MIKSTVIVSCYFFTFARKDVRSDNPCSKK